MTTTEATIRPDLAIPRLGNRGWSVCAGLFAVTMLLYFRTRTYGFINYDDQVYVYKNIEITGGFSLAALRSAMTATVNGNWHPLTTLGWLLICSVFGINGGAFHLANAVLHAINAALLFAFLQRATGRFWPATFVAALWALHPQRVESVAWVTELKDCLCGTMWLLCLLTYVSYSRHRTAGRYILVIALYVAAMLAKAMAITLPFVLLLLDYWPLGFSQPGEVSHKRGWKYRVLEKLPLLALCAVDILIGIRAQRAKHLGSTLAEIPMSLRVQNALVSYCDYIRDAFYPYHLSIFYPHPSSIAGGTIPLGGTLLATGVLLAISLFACIAIKRRPYFFVGWFWFVGTLIPVIGLFQSGPQARADRFTYLPSIGFAIAVVWLVADACRSRVVYRYAATAVGGIVAVALAIATVVQVGYWRDEPTLFSHVLEIQPDNFVALHVRADELRALGRIDEAIAMNERAVAIAPMDAATHASYGLALQRAKRYDDAVFQLKQSLYLSPWSSDAWDGLGAVRDSQANQAQAQHSEEEKGFRQQAINDFRRAYEQDPENVEAGEHLAFELAIMNQMDEAISVWKDVLAKSPAYAQAQGDLADALRVKGDLGGAVAHYRAALDAGSKNPAWESQLVYLVATSPQATLADLQPLVAIAKDACERTHNTDPGALDAYGACLARLGRFDDAMAAAQQGIDQARAAHQPLVAAGIQKHLAKYQRQLPWVAGDS